MILHPGEIYKIVRVLEDPTDTGTYYIQAVVRRSDDNTVLSTVNLTDNGDRRFTGDWQVIQAQGANGDYVDITITIYTDSGYSTVSSNYAEKNTTFLVQERLTRVDMPFGGIGGADVNYKKIKKIVEEVVENRKLQQIPETDLSNLDKRLLEAINKIDSIFIPEPEKLDLMPVLAKISETSYNINKAINDKEVTPATDLKPIIISNSEENTKTLKEIQKSLVEVFNFIKSDNNNIKKFIKEAGDRFQVSDKLKKVLSSSFNASLFGKEEKEEPKKKRFFN